jgi:hypothetical protein
MVEVTGLEIMASRSPSMAILEPEPTQHSKATLSGQTSPDTCGSIYPDMSSQTSTNKKTFISQFAYCRRCETLHDVRSDDHWDDVLLMDSNLCLKFMKKRKRWMHRLWESRTDGEHTVHKNA